MVAHSNANSTQLDVHVVDFLQGNLTQLTTPPHGVSLQEVWSLGSTHCQCWYPGRDAGMRSVWLFAGMTAAVTAAQRFSVPFCNLCCSLPNPGISCNVAQHRRCILLCCCPCSCPKTHPKTIGATSLPPTLMASSTLCVLPTPC